MINPVNFNNNVKAFTSGYDNETQNLLYMAETIFDDINVSKVPADLYISSTQGDTDLIKTIDGKRVCLSKSSGGNILLQVADEKKEAVDVYFHNSIDKFSDKYYKYKDTRLFPWNEGKDIKLYSNRILNMEKLQVENVNSIFKKYIPEFLKAVKNSIIR